MDDTAGQQVAFEIEGQLAGQITNVGGNQNTFLSDTETGTSIFGRAIAMLGLIVSFAGVGLLVLGGVKTADAVMPPPSDWAQYQDYVATKWLSVGLILIVIGIVVGKTGRLLARR